MVNEPALALLRGPVRRAGQTRRGRAEQRGTHRCGGGEDDGGEEEEGDGDELHDLARVEAGKPAAGRGL